MAITLRQTATDTSGKSTELSYQEMNNNLKSFYYSSSLSGNTLNLHFLSGSTSHSIDLSSYLDNTNIYSNDGTLTGARTVTADSNNLTFDMTTAYFTINTDPAQRVIINGLNTGDNAQVLGIDSNGVLKAMNTSSIAGEGGTPGGSDTQVQYNNGGSFGGSAIYFDDVNSTVGINVAPYSNRALAISSSLGIPVRLQSTVTSANRIQFVNASSVGNGVLMGAIDGDSFHIQQTDGDLITNLYISSSGEAYLPRIATSSKANVVGFDSSTGELTYFSTASLGGGSGTPGGSDTQVQFNDGGSFGGDSGFLYDKTNNKLTVVSAGTGATTNPTIQLGTSDVSIAPGDTVGRISFSNTDSTYGGATSYAAIYAVAPSNWGGGQYPKDVRIAAVASAATVDVATFKGSGVVQLHDYGSGNNTGTAAKWLAVDSSGNMIEEAPPSGFTRPGSATSINYDTYLQDVGFDVAYVGTNPTAPSANGEVAVRYAVSNVGSNVDRIDVYKSNGSGTDRSQTLENLAVSGSIVLLQVGAGSHTENYRIISITDNSTYMSYAVEWESGDDAAITTNTTDTLTFNSDYEYELSTGYNRLLVNNDSNSTAQRFRFAPPSSANAGDEVVVEIVRNTSSINMQLAYVIRGVDGGLSFYHDQDITELNGTTIQKITLNAAGQSAMIRFQVNDIGSSQGLTLLGANRFVYS